jgi:nucleoid-associated protein YgaU
MVVDKMGKTSNRFIATLAISNILAFVVIFTLLWMIWTDKKNTQQKNIVVTYSPSELAAIQPAAGPVHNTDTKVTRPSVNARDLSIITAVAKEVKSNIESSPRIELNTEMENMASDKAQPNKITGAISDKEYVASYNELVAKPQTEKKAFSEKEVSSTPAIAKGTNDSAGSVDHFNKVDVSNIAPQKQASLAQQVAMVAADDSTGNNTGEPEKTASWKDYLAALKKAEAERQNEMRTITVKRGDTLWQISERAYGTGFKYNKIFTANPHLTSPDDITVGETLRVPL